VTRKLFHQFEPGFFPDPRTYDFPEWVLVGEYFYHAADVVTFGTPLTVETVAEAYRKGIFPWYMRNVPLPWYCPEQRAVLEFDELKVSRSLAKSQRQSRFTFTIDRDFEAVMRGCAAVKRPDQGGTWITADFMYTQPFIKREQLTASRLGTTKADLSAAFTALTLAACSAANRCSTSNPMLRSWLCCF
jgi:hypothetical protein